MAVGDVLQGKFTRPYSLGAQLVNGLIGGSTYSYFRIKADTEMLVGNSAIDHQSGTLTQQGYRMEPGEVMELRNDGAVAGVLDGGKISVRGISESPPASFHIFAIANV